MSRISTEIPRLTQLMAPPSPSSPSPTPAPSSPPPPATTPPTPVPAAIGASPLSLSFAATQGGTNPATQTLSISSTGGGNLAWSANDNAPWLSLSPASGSGNGAVTLAVTTSGLSTGSHTGLVTLTASGASSITVPVTFNVTAPAVQTTMNLNPTRLAFNGTAGGSNPATQTITVTSSGSGPLSWNVTDNANWLTASQSESSVMASVNLAGLSAGSYNGLVTVSASVATNTPQTVPVTLTVIAAPPPPPPPTTGSVTISWSANTEPDLAGYKVYRATSSGAYGAPATTITGNTPQYISNGLPVGTTYFFVITAFDKAGNESAFSREVSKSIY